MRSLRFTRSHALLLSGLVLAACGGEEAETPAVDTAAEPMAAPPAAAPAAAPAGAVPAGATAEMVAQGQQLFTGSGICFTCHGQNGQGTQLGPNLADQEWLWIDPAQGDVMTQLTTLIETGVSQPKQYPAPMPAMGGAQLTPEQLQAVSAYVASLGGLPQG